MEVAAMVVDAGRAEGGKADAREQAVRVAEAEAKVEVGVRAVVESKSLPGLLHMHNRCPPGSAHPLHIFQTRPSAQASLALSLHPRTSPFLCTTGRRTHHHPPSPRESLCSSQGREEGVVAKVEAAAVGLGVVMEGPQRR